MGKLVLHLPDGSTRDIPLSRERMTIGRRADNDICLPLPTVSGEHAAVVTILDDSFLEDLGSRNGTLVNGKPVTKHFLRDHDEIDIGRQRLVYFSGEFASVATQPIVSAAGMSDEPSGQPVTRFAGETGAAPAANATMLIDTAELFGEPAPCAEPAAAPGAAPSLEVLDGPHAGTVASVAADTFLLGRLGVAIAAVRRTPDGWRLEHVEGDVAPTINGAGLPQEGALLALGDEIEVAGTRLAWRPGMPSSASRVK